MAINTSLTMLFVWTIGTADGGMAKVLVENFQFVGNFPSMEACNHVAEQIATPIGWKDYIIFPGKTDRDGKSTVREEFHLRIRTKCVSPLGGNKDR